MYAVFNLVIIGLVLLIAYWWANQGLFSAILHLLCVVTAGAIALAIWEPLVTKLLLHNTFFDNYAWGLGLVVPFVLILLVLRVILDKTIGNNVDLPRWANLTFGFVAGAAAGVITVGIFVIGSGFIQSHREIMGFTGYARSGRNAEVTEIQSMWLPVHSLTADFYSLLSAGSLYPTFNDTPLKQYYPALDHQAVSLQRDSFNNGKGRTTLTPADASVDKVLVCDTCNPKRFAVSMVFEGGARDYGEQFTLSSSQVRLIGKSSGFTDAKTAHPVEFTQYSGHHRFDDSSHYISSEPGQQRAVATIEFNQSDLGSQAPAFIQVRGTRYRLPKPGTPQWQIVDAASYRALLGSSGSTGGNVDLAPNGIDITTAIKQANDIRPISVSINGLPSGIQTTKVNDKNWISSGDGEFFTISPNRPGRGLEVAGILQPGGTSLVQVDVSLSSKANIFKESLRAAANDGDPAVVLVDDKGRPYSAVGYMWTRPDGKTRVRVDFEKQIRRMSEMPTLPSSDTHKLKLIFAVTNGSRVAGLKVGDAVVGTCSVLIDDPDKLKSQQNQGGESPGGETVGGG